VRAGVRPPAPAIPCRAGLPLHGAERRGAELPAGAARGIRLAALLDGVSAKHRAAVATRLGLPKQARAAEISEWLLDPVQLEQLLDGLSPEARGRAAGKVLSPEPASHGYYFGGRTATGGDDELERCGLAFAFRGSWQTEYRIADDLCGPLGHTLAGLHARRTKAGRAARWVGAPLQLAHDVAAIWAALHREPVRVKTDGEIYQRSWPKLRAVLAPTGLEQLDDELGDRRLDAALSFLREQACVRLRLDASDGWETKRELIPSGDLLGVLEHEPGELQARLLHYAGGDRLEHAALILLARLEGSAVSLASFGAAARGFAQEAGPYASHYPGSDAQVGARAAWIAWLAGIAEIGVSDGGNASAVRAASVEPEPRSRPLAVCQGNFEVVLLGRPTPGERLALELTCEPVAGQPHVYTITRASATAGERAGANPDGAIGMLGELAGELPQNVERTVREWVSGLGPPLRVRTAMMLDAGDPATAARLAHGALAGLVLEQISETLLAFPANRLHDVERALRSAGRELEPGLDQISGTWKEPRAGSSEAQAEWVPRHHAEPPPEGRLVSTIRPDRAARSGLRPAPRPSQQPAPPPRQEVLIIESDGDQDAALDVILAAIEDEFDVEISYAGADGITHRTITPLEVLGAQVHAWCHLKDDEHRFWIPSIMSASPVP
jgi:hypothetical protein